MNDGLMNPSFFVHETHVVLRRHVDITIILFAYYPILCDTMRRKYA